VVLALALLQLAVLSRAQVLDQQVVSVTRFTSCVDSGLGSSAVQNVTGLDPGEQLDATVPTVDACAGQTNVIAIGLRIQPRAVQGGQTFRFTLGGLSPSDVRYDDASDGDVRVCGNATTGTDCTVLQNELSISVSSTELFAAYDLLPVRQIPFAYRNRFAVVDRKHLNKVVCNDEDGSGADDAVCANGDGYDIPGPGQSYLIQRECAPGDSLSEVFSIGSIKVGDNLFESSQGQTGADVCEVLQGSPDAFAEQRSWQYYYTGPQTSPYLPRSGQCDLAVIGPASGSSEGADGYFVEAVQFGPQCMVYNTEPRAKPAMHLEFVVDQGNSSQRVRLGTEQFGAIKGVPGVMFAQINGVNTPTGLLGPFLNGQYVVCNTCADDTADCVPGFMDDLAGGPATTPPDGTLKTLYNPYREYGLGARATGRDKQCPLPAARCREQFAGAPEGAFAYFVPDHRVVENAAVCNGNAVSSNLYEDPDIRRFVANTIAQCTSAVGNTQSSSDPDVCLAFDACLPGHEQPNVSPTTVYNRNFVKTPCGVSRAFADSLAELDPEAFDNTFSDTELDRNFIAPQYFHRNGRVYRDSYGGSSASLFVTLYVVAEDVVSVVSIAPGRFAASGLTCGGTNAGAGAIGFRVLNTGASVGTYAVDVGFFLPENDAQSLTVQDGAQPLVQRVGRLAGADAVFRLSQLQAPAGGTVDGTLNYEYAGELGDRVRVVLVLRVDTASGSQQLDEAEARCANIEGVTQNTALLNEDDPYEDPPPELRNFRFTLLQYILLLALLVLFVFAMVSLCFCVYNFNNATAPARQALASAKRLPKAKTQ
jgi:hypothetical protein